MATVYLQPGTGNGQGTLADPYYYSELTTAQNAATLTGTTDGVILLTDGDYESNADVFIGALSASSTVTLEIKSLNRHGATIKNTDTTIGEDIRTGTNSGLFTLKLTDLAVHNYHFYCNSNPTELLGIKSVFTGINSNGNGVFRGSGIVTITKCQFFYNPNSSSVFLVWNRANNTTIDSCSFYFDTDSATSAGNTGSSPEIYNNTIIASNNGSIFTADLFGASGMTNCCLNNVFVTSASSGATDCIDGDPQYVSTDSASPDLRLRPNSPCIGAGTAS